MTRAPGTEQERAMRRDQTTDADETAFQMNAEVDELLDELSYVPPLEVARELIDNPADLDEGHARRLAEIIRDRVRGAGALQAGPARPTIRRPN